MKEKKPRKEPADTPAPKTAPPASGSSDELSPISLLKKLRSGAMPPGSLPIPTRQACVEHLSGEGVSDSEIAEILQTSMRTLYRDKEAIRKKNSLSPYPGLTEEMAGRLLMEADRACAKLRRIARDKDTPPAVRADAEYRAWRVFCEYFSRMQSLGYLPTAVQRVQADLTHRMDQAQTVELVQQEFARLEGILKDTGGDDPVLRAQLETGRSLLRGIEMKPDESGDPTTNPKEETEDDPEEES